MGSKITADGVCSHEVKRHLLFGRKVMTNSAYFHTVHGVLKARILKWFATTNLDSILKSRDISLPTKVCLVKAMVCPVVMYGYESWTVKKAECRRMMLLNCGVGEDS